MLKALQMADYRSYRENTAFRYLRRSGYDTSGDLLYPDLVFSLPGESVPTSQEASCAARTVGVGLINYCGWRHDAQGGDAIYRQYVAKMKCFVLCLLSKGFTIRIMSGDRTDQRPVAEVAGCVHDQGNAAWSQRLITEPIACVDDLLRQMAQVDMVVASRFHNVLCALMVGVPVISVGYHEKNRELMQEMGLEKYCQDIEDFTCEKLMEQCESYASEWKQAAQRIHRKKEVYRDLLNEQYCKILA
jgi:polysaccharide pyruvyl transferase WcaK-like protein